MARSSRCYVNGVNVGEETPAAPPKANFAAPLYLGKRGFGDWLFNGDLDEAAVYGTALRPATILSHYQNGINATRATPYETLVQTSAPVGYWRLNETVQPRSDRGTIFTNIETGNSSTVGRIFLTAGDYPISSTFWEGGGGASFEIFASQEVDGVAGPLQGLRKDPWPSIEGATGLDLGVAQPAGATSAGWRPDDQSGWQPQHHVPVGGWRLVHAAEFDHPGDLADRPDRGGDDNDDNDHRSRRRVVLLRS